MRNYQCKRCQTIVQSERMPLMNKCLDGTVHIWTDLGEVGPDNYRCTRCGLLLRSAKMPSYVTCPGGSLHTWQKL